MSSEGVVGTDHDMVAIKATSGAKAGGGVMAGAGVLSLVLAFQGFVILGLRGVYQLSEPVFLLLGALGVFAGARLAAMRGVGALLTTIVGGLTCVTALGWFVVTLTHGLFLVLPMFLAPLGALAALLGVLNLAKTRDADIARSRLREQGLDAGF